ncbi:hypothetical protein ACHHYP_07432 [Achlya hypogyna]|uniref:Tubulin--tyrosine ligase-like protein 5 n=1 Tax=Achlya hypogyna TaxID=1202772 RepID=A0A1V9ZM63_ACHHY|nr:hypothetical protein ACHHYP_07432 [Achlya hypogyna]
MLRACVVALVLAAAAGDKRHTKSFLLPEKERYHLGPLLKALDRLGVEEVEGSSAKSWKMAKRTTDFDLVWSYEYTQLSSLGPLERRHKVNHLPGSYVLVSKGQVYETQLRLQDLHGRYDFNFIPAQYRLPQDVDQFSAAFRERRESAATKDDDPDYNKRWLLKSQSHRGVRFFSGLEDLASHMNSNDMVTHCIEPLLISGHKFDMGLYVAVTSLDPLRIYIYHNTLLRMCKLPYPASLDNTADLESYVVDDYLPPWEMPALKALYSEIPSPTNEGTSHFEVLKHHLESIGIDPDKFQRELYGDVVKIITGNRRHFMQAERAFRRQHQQPHDALGNFFEMYRFDFMVEDTGKPWLMEVNQSPNLAPKYFESGTDAAMKDTIIHDLLHMVGITAPGDPLITPPQLTPAECATKCDDKSAVWETVCWHCDGWFAPDVADTLFESATEYARRGKYKLVFPTPENDFAQFLEDGPTPNDDALVAYLASFGSNPAADRTIMLDNVALCTNRGHCSRHGDCINGACVCDIGFEGATCYVPTGQRRDEDKPELHPANLRIAQNEPLYSRATVFGLFVVVIGLAGALAYANRAYLKKASSKEQ